MPFLALLSIILLAATSAANAQSGVTDSAYTPLEFQDCQVLEKFEEQGSVSWMCEGYQGIPVYVAEGDLRFYVAAGSRPERRTAAGQTMPNFNIIHTTMEWRLERRGGQWRPFATILRYFLAPLDDTGIQTQTLVIAKLGRRDSCHVAYVNASGVPNANQTARRVADERARGFDCGSDQPVWIGY